MAAPVGRRLLGRWRVLWLLRLCGETEGRQLVCPAEGAIWQCLVWLSGEHQAFGCRLGFLEYGRRHVR